MKLFNIFTTLNSKLSNYQNIFGLLGMLVSFVALTIAIIALTDSRLEPSLNFKYQVYQSTEDLDNKYYENENGKILLSVDIETIIKSEYENTVQVSNTVPETSLNIKLENTGKISARNPAIYMKFEGFRIGQDTASIWKDWSPRSHYRGIGGWAEIIWSPTDNNIVHPGIPIEFVQLSFADAIFELGEDAFIDVIIVADKFKAKKIRIPVVPYDMGSGEVVNKNYKSK